MIVENRFGKGELYTIDEVYNELGITGMIKVYCESTACMSVTSDMMSWVSSGEHRSKIAFVDMNKPGYNNVIIVLGCQVTDLAIFNDINKARALHEENPEAKVFMGGCLAYRFDIPLPGFISRLGAVRTEYQEITPESLEPEDISLVVMNGYQGRFPASGPVQIQTEAKGAGRRILLKKGEQVETEYHLPGKVEAPVEKGQELGSAVCTVDGETVAVFTLNAGAAVERRDLSACAGYIMKLFSLGRQKRSIEMIKFVTGAAAYHMIG